MVEVWADIEGYPGYSVSTLGRVMGLKGGILKPGAHSSGYSSVNLYKGKVGKTTLIHRLVAEAFIPNPDGKRTVNHKNGVKTDNRLENIEWNTYRENLRHAVDNGLRSEKSFFEAGRAGNISRRKLTNGQALAVIDRYESGDRVVLLAKEYGVHKSTIKRILSRKNYKDIHGND